MCQCDYQFPCEEHEYDIRCCLEPQPDVPDVCRVPTEEERTILRALIDSARYVPKAGQHD